MSRLVVAALALVGAGCTCRGGPLSTNAGELVFLTSDGTGGDLQSSNGLFTVPDVAMEDVGTSEVRLRNVGNAPLTIAHAAPAQDDGVFTLPDLEGLRLEAGADAVATVRFAPPQHTDQTLARVEHHASFALELTGTRPDAANAALELDGAALARDCFVRAEVDFGEVAVGLRVSIPFALENGKPSVSHVLFAAIAGEDPAFFELGAVPTELAPGKREEVPLWFGPSAERSYRAAVEVQRSGCSPVTVLLKGRGVTSSLAWAPTTLDFGKVPLGQTTPTQMVTISNRSRATLRLAQAAPLVDYVVEAPTVVAPNGVTKLLVACRPTALGRLTSTLELSVDTSPATPMRVPLTCQGGGPRVRLAPTPLNMGTVPMLGTGPSSIRRLTVQNVGTPPNFPNDTSNNLVLGVQGVPPIVSIVPMVPGVAPGEFEVVVPSSYPATGVPALAGSNSVNLDVLFKPHGLGLKQVEVRVYTNDALTPFSRVVVSAEAVPAQSCSGLSVTPVALAFGDAPRGGSFMRTITVQNSGALPCTLGGFDLTPDSSSVFSMVEAGTTLTVPPFNSAVVRVRATISATAEEGATERGFARFFTTDRAKPMVRVPVEVRVASCVVFSPTAFDFGFTGVGCRSAELALTLYDTCGVPVTLEALSLVPPTAPFAITAGPAIVAPGLELTPGSAVNWGVTFAPDAGVGQSVSAVLAATVSQAGARRVVQVPLAGLALADSHIVETFQQGRGDLDILFIVDDSCSMADEQASLATNFDSFIQHALRTNSNFNLAVTTTDVFSVNGAFRGMPGILTRQTPSLTSAFASRAIAGTSGSGFERPFDALLRALTPPMSTGPNLGFLRNNVPLAAIIVTDAVEQSTLPVSAYLAQLRALKANRADLVNVSVVGPFSPPSTTCFLDSTVDMGRYDEIIKATGGVKADICTTNWARDLDVIGSTVLGLARRFPLKTRPDNTRPITVTVDGVARTTGWSWESRDNAITFTSPPAPGATVTVAYSTPCL